MYKFNKPSNNLTNVTGRDIEILVYELWLKPSPAELSVAEPSVNGYEPEPSHCLLEPVLAEPSRAEPSRGNTKSD